MKVSEIIQNMREDGITSRSSFSQEKKVMNAMINDPDFSMSITRYGKKVEICPHDEYKDIVESILRHGANVSQQEAASLSENYSPRISEAGNLLNIGKAFIHTYGVSTISDECDSGPKINLGKIINPEDSSMNSNISIQFRRVGPSTRLYPYPASKDDKGNITWDRRQIEVPSHVVLHASSPCPKVKE